MKVLFTGGGSSGHVTPNFPLIEACAAIGAASVYVGSKDGIEASLVKKLGIPYYAIVAGKLRRYWSWKNFLIPFQLLFSIVQSFLLCLRLKPHIVFSKGGFVAFPVVIAAWVSQIPIIIHESDSTPGLANRFSFPFAKLICVTFPNTVTYFKKRKKVLLTGIPIRKFLYHGDRLKGLKQCGFTEKKPVLLIMAGGLGSTFINNIIYRLLIPLTEKFQIIHLCGKGKAVSQFDTIVGYKQFEYIHDGLADLLACADLVLSRAGATSIYELLALKKPHILLPLSKKASRGDQVENADYFAKQGLSIVLYEEDLSDKKLLNTIFYGYENLDKIKNKLMSFELPDSITLITNKLIELAKIS